MSMERTEVLDMMGELKLVGMKGAGACPRAGEARPVGRDPGLRDQAHEPQRLVGDLLKAEISEKQARSIRYQLTIAKLPLAKDVDDFAFNGTPINENLVRDLAGGSFIAQQRNLVLVGGTGTGKDAPPGQAPEGKPGDRYRAKLYPRRVSRPILHHHRSGQPARGRGTGGPPGTDCRLSHPSGLRRPR